MALPVRAQARGAQWAAETAERGARLATETAEQGARRGKAHEERRPAAKPAPEQPPARAGAHPLPERAARSSA